jgi:hypothetical protein
VKVLQMTVVEDKAKPVGYSSLLLRSSDLPSGGAVTAIQLIQDLNGPNYLACSGWQPERAWIPVQGSDDGAGQTAVELGPDVTRHINTNSNVEIRASVDGTNAFGSGHLIWPAIQQQARSSRRRGRPVVGGGRKAEPEAPATPIPPSAPVAPTPEPVPSPEQEWTTGGTPSEASSKIGFIIGGAIASVLIVAGVLTFVFSDKLPFGGREQTETAGAKEPAQETDKLPFGGREQTETAGAKEPAQETGKLPTVGQVRAQISGSPPPSAEEFVAQAELQMKAGNLDAALLLYKAAGQAGSPAGTTGFAKMYDPGLHGPTTSPFGKPNAGRAVELYEKAANLGDAFAMRRLGILLYEGGSGISTDKTAGADWLNKAAEAGDTEAKGYLENL